MILNRKLFLFITILLVFNIFSVVEINGRAIENDVNDNNLVSVTKNVVNNDLSTENEIQENSNFQLMSTNIVSPDQSIIINQEPDPPIMSYTVSNYTFDFDLDGLQDIMGLYIKVNYSFTQLSYVQAVTSLNWWNTTSLAWEIVGNTENSFFGFGIGKDDLDLVMFVPYSGDYEISLSIYLNNEFFGIEVFHFPNMQVHDISVRGESNTIYLSMLYPALDWDNNGVNDTFRYWREFMFDKSQPSLIETVFDVYLDTGSWTHLESFNRTFIAEGYSRKTISAYYNVKQSGNYLINITTYVDGIMVRTPHSMEGYNLSPLTLSHRIVALDQNPTFSMSWGDGDSNHELMVLGFDIIHYVDVQSIIHYETKLLYWNATLRLYQSITSNNFYGILNGLNIFNVGSFFLAPFNGDYQLSITIWIDDSEYYFNSWDILGMNTYTVIDDLGRISGINPDGIDWDNDGVSDTFIIFSQWVSGFIGQGQIEAKYDVYYFDEIQSDFVLMDTLWDSFTLLDNSSESSFLWYNAPILGEYKINRTIYKNDIEWNSERTLFTSFLEPFVIDEFIDIRSDGSYTTDWDNDTFDDTMAIYYSSNHYQVSPTLIEAEIEYYFYNTQSSTYDLQYLQKDQVYIKGFGFNVNVVDPIIFALYNGDYRIVVNLYKNGQAFYTDTTDFNNLNSYDFTTTGRITLPIQEDFDFDFRSDLIHQITFYSYDVPVSSQLEITYEISKYNPSNDQYEIYDTIINQYEIYGRGGLFSNLHWSAAEKGDFRINMSRTVNGIYEGYLVTNYYSIYPPIDFLSPKFNHPLDMIYELQSTGNQILWQISDPFPGVYSIEFDGIEIERGKWVLDNEISLNIDGLSVGTYEYKLLAWDSSGNLAFDTVFVTVIVDTISPSISDNPLDLTYEEGNTGNTLIWIVTDGNADKYNATLNGALFVPDTMWLSGEPIEINVDGLTIGSYILIIYIYDTWGNLVTDTISIFVIENSPPEFIQVPSPVSYIVGSIGNTLIWVAIDTDPSLYTVNLDGSLLVASTPWISGEKIEVAIDNFSVGTHTITITLIDEFGGITEHTVSVTVTEQMITSSTEPSDTETSQSAGIDGLGLLGSLLILPLIILIRSNFDFRRTRKS